MAAPPLCVGQTTQLEQIGFFIELEIVSEFAGVAVNGRHGIRLRRP